jgi:trehalose 6-phosphate phosphatase
MHHQSKKNRKEQPVEALIFDLDGVITQTRKTHKKAWKELFEWFFQQERMEDQSPMSESDYLDYIDGKPRYQGVKSFLESRGIELPFGHSSDAPGTGTACALGNRKNEFFNKVIDEEGVELYDDAVEWLKHWRAKGLKTAIVSSSKNCKKIIEVAGIQDLFDTRVDGLISEETGLKGKPDPDIFSEAARRLDVHPGHAVVFEDAISGVQAGQRGFFGLVVGVNRYDNGEALKKQGADIIIENFSELDLHDEELQEEYFSMHGAPVFPENEEIFNILSQRKPAIFLDYDGTLTPIVPRPEDAVISEEMKDTLRELAKLFTVAVVTGRDKEDVENLVGLDELIYAGSHGYIITGPDDLFMEHEDSKKIISELDEIEQEVAEALEEKTKGTQLDRKRYAIGIHFRNARPEDEETVYKLVDEMLEKYPGHKKGEGKKIVEIKPDLDWHKGKAVLWILDALDLEDKDDVVPVFIGDDITDEDAFEALREKGIGILVGGHGQETAAGYTMKNVYQVRMFFNKLIELYQEKK